MSKIKLTSPKIFLILICLFFLITRLYKISEIPPSVYWDEASLGYNAYSVLKGGRDEWGEFLPIEFRAFGEYKLPVYIYSIIPFIYFFDLNELSVRLPAVIFSLGVVIVTFLLTNQLFSSNKIGLFGAFFTTISQWFFIISRTGYEATAGLFFYILGLFLFLNANSNVRKYLFVLSAVSFTISLYSYNSFRIVTPLTLLILLIIYYKDLLVRLKKDFMVLVISLIIITIGFCGIVSSINSGKSSRLEDVGISIAYNQKKYQMLGEIFSNYLTHFNPQFLFFSGDINKRSQLPMFGQINFFSIPLLFLGIFFIFQKRNRNYFLPLILLLIGPIPASITKESPHALRTISVVPFIAIISALGLYKLASFFKKNIYIYVFVLALSIVTFGLYYRNFILDYSKLTSNEWQYPYKMVYKNMDFEKYDHIIVSDRYAQPYIFALFYLKYDPSKFRNEVLYNQTIRKETSLVYGFDKFLFTNIDFYQFPEGTNLIFAHPTERMDEIQYKYIINNPDGDIAWYVYEYEK